MYVLVCMEMEDVQKQVRLVGKLDDIRAGLEGCTS
jgi:hypothetical protein